MKEKKTFQDYKYLVVEDQKDARAMCRNLLAELGVTQVFECPNGREALTFVDAAVELVDIIICDWNMPEMSGMDFLKQLRTVYPDMPFLMVTGRNDMDSVIEAKGYGVNAYIAKPYSSTQLEAKLRVVAHRMQE